MRFRGKVWMLAVLIVILFVIGCTNQKFMPSKTTALNNDDAKKLEQFGRTADELYQKTAAGDYHAAYVKAQELGNLLPALPLQGMVSAEGMKALTDTVVEAKRTFAAAKLSPDSALLVSAKLRLAADALTHRHEPMWYQYDKVLQEDLRSMMSAAQQKQPAALSKAFVLYNQHYQLIRPSLLISRDPSQAERGDSFVAFMRNGTQGKELKYAELANGIERFSEHLGEWFDRSKDEKTAYMPMKETGNPLIWSLLLGLFIVSVLSFAAWRMFPDKSGAPRIRSAREDSYK